MTRSDFCQTAFEMAQIFWLTASALAYNTLSCQETDAKTRVRECEILVDFHNSSDKALLINLQCISKRNMQDYTGMFQIFSLAPSVLAHSAVLRRAGAQKVDTLDCVILTDLGETA